MRSFDTCVAIQLRCAVHDETVTGESLSLDETLLDDLRDTSFSFKKIGKS